MAQCLDPLTLDPHACPALNPPPGTQAMDPNAFTLGPHVIAISIVSLLLVCFAVAIRTYSKYFLLKKMQMEDCRFPLLRRNFRNAHLQTGLVLIALVLCSFDTKLPR
jgi:hypothetical protein